MHRKCQLSDGNHTNTCSQHSTLLQECSQWTLTWRLRRFWSKGMSHQKRLCSKCQRPASQQSCGADLALCLEFRWKQQRCTERFQRSSRHQSAQLAGHKALQPGQALHFNATCPFPPLRLVCSKVCLGLWQCIAADSHVKYSQQLGCILVVWSSSSVTTCMVSIECRTLFNVVDQTSCAAYCVWIVAAYAMWVNFSCKAAL